MERLKWSSEDYFFLNRSRIWQPTPVFLSGQSHGQRSLVGFSPWGHERVGHDLVTKQLDNFYKNMNVT